MFGALAGMSRSGVDDVGGMAIGSGGGSSAISFLAAVPIMFAATAFDLYKSLTILQGSDLPMFAIGLSCPS